MARFVTFFVVSCCIAFACFAVWYSAPNWDMLAYVASVQAESISDVNELQQAVYSEASKVLSPVEYEELVNSSDYRQVMASDAELFALQMPYYQPRVLFLKLIAGLVAVGVPILTAGHVISSVAAALAGFVLFMAFRPSIKNILWFAFPVVFVLSGALETARMFSPDTLALLVFALAYYAFSRNHWSFFLVMMPAVFVRTDLIVLVSLCMGFIVLFRPSLWLPAVVTGAVSIAGYLGINHSVGNFGWSVVYYYVFESGMQATDPREFQDYVVTPLVYVKTILANLSRASGFPPLWFFIYSIFVSLVLRLNVMQRSVANSAVNDTVLLQEGSALTWWARVQSWAAEPQLVAIVTCILYMKLHYLMFPLLDTRFFVGPYMVAAFCCLSYLSQVLSANESSTVAPNRAAKK